MRNRLASLASVPGLAAALASLTAAAPLLLYPPGRDQSVFLLGARSLLAGKRLYLEFWDIKPPGLFLAYLPAALLARWWPGAAALIDLLALSAAVLVAAHLARAVGRGTAAAPAALLLTGLWIFAGDWWDLGQGERLAAPLLLGALLAACRPRPRRWLIAGLCLGGLALLKTSLLAPAPALLPLLPWRRPPEPGVRTGPARLAGLAAGGALLPPALAWLGLALTGSFDAAWQATVTFTSHYTRLAWRQPEVILGTLQVTGLAFLQGTWPLWLLAGAALWPRAIAAADGSPDGDGHAAPALARALALALALGLATVIAQGKFFPYHWIVLWSPLAMLAGLGAARLARRRRAIALGLALLAAAAAAFSSAPGRAGYGASLQRAAGALAAADQRAVFRVQGMGMDELAAVAERVAGATPDGSPVLLWGFEPAFYLYAGRDFPGRFPFAYPLVTPWAPAGWRADWLDAVRATPPAAVVVRRGDPIPWVAGVAGDAAARMARLPEMEALLRRDYRPRPDLSSRHLQVWIAVAGSTPHR